MDEDLLISRNAYHFQHNRKFGKEAASNRKFGNIQNFNFLISIALYFDFEIPVYSLKVLSILFYLCFHLL